MWWYVHSAEIFLFFGFFGFKAFILRIYFTSFLDLILGIAIGLFIWFLSVLFCNFICTWYILCIWACVCLWNKKAINQRPNEIPWLFKQNGRANKEKISLDSILIHTMNKWNLINAHVSLIVRIFLVSFRLHAYLLFLLLFFITLFLRLLVFVVGGVILLSS